MAKINLERIKDITNMAKQLAVALRNLTFSDNFDSYVEEITIAATSEARIRHDLNVVPTEYIIVSQSGNGLITKGTTDWTSDFAYFYNNGGSSVTVKIRIFK